MAGNILGYTKPERLSPQWYVGYLAFQGGHQQIRTGSLTGGGQIYGHPFISTFQPVVLAYGTPVTSITAGGQIPSKPSFLTKLFGGDSGAGN